MQVQVENSEELDVTQAGKEVEWTVNRCHVQDGNDVGVAIECKAVQKLETRDELEGTQAGKELEWAGRYRTEMKVG